MGRVMTLKSVMSKGQVLERPDGPLGPELPPGPMILPKNLREALREYEPLRASAYWRDGTEPGREVIDELRAFWKSIVMPVPAQNEHGAQAEPARGGRR